MNGWDLLTETDPGRAEVRKAVMVTLAQMYADEAAAMKRASGG